MISLFEIALGFMLFAICGGIFLVANYYYSFTNSVFETKKDNQHIKTEKESKL